MFGTPSVFIPLLQEKLAECGIAFCIVPSFKGALVQGFIKNSTSGKVILCMTFRQKRADVFWFSFFHELAHLITGDTKQRFIDFESVETLREQKADAFAQNALLGKKDYERFISKNDFSLSSIKQFALAQNVLPCIVIGRLKKEKYLKWTDYPEENLMYDR